MSNPKVVIAEHEPDQASLRGYLIGFGSSLILTLGAYFIVTHGNLSQATKVTLVTILALSQFMVQLVYFLHLGREFKPRWKLFVFIFMIGVVSILVAGSLWIMTDLNNRMSPAQETNYMNDQDGL